MPFDEHVEPAVDDVLSAAALLDITEFDLFRLAWTRWYGETAEDRVIEPFFVAYMFDRVVPVWVRHFARLVRRLARRRVLDRTALGVERLARSRRMVRRGTRYAVLIVTVIVSLVICAEFAAQVLDLGGRCSFPPCY